MKNTLLSLDFFPLKFSFNYKNQKGYQTLVGAFLSIIFLAFIIYAAFSLFDELINGNSLKTKITSFLAKNQINKLELNNMFFMMKFRLDDGSKEVEEDLKEYLRMKVSLRNENDHNGVEKDFNLTLCKNLVNSNQYKNKLGSRIKIQRNLSSEFSKYLNNSYCVDSDQGHITNKDKLILEIFADQNKSKDFQSLEMKFISLENILRFEPNSAVPKDINFNKQMDVYTFIYDFKQKSPKHFSLNYQTSKIGLSGMSHLFSLFNGDPEGGTFYRTTLKQEESLEIPKGLKKEIAVLKMSLGTSNEAENVTISFSSILDIIGSIGGLMEFLSQIKVLLHSCLYTDSLTDELKDELYEFNVHFGIQQMEPESPPDIDSEQIIDKKNTVLKKVAVIDKESVNDQGRTASDNLLSKEVESAVNSKYKAGFCVKFFKCFYCRDEDKLKDFEKIRQIRDSTTPFLLDLIDVFNLIRMLSYINHYVMPRNKLDGKYNPELLDKVKDLKDIEKQYLKKESIRSVGFYKDKAHLYDDGVSDN